MSVRLKPETPQHGSTPWSMPIGAEFPEGGQRHVLIPIAGPQHVSAESSSQNEAGSYMRHIQTLLTAGPAWELEGPRVVRRIKHYAQYGPTCKALLGMRI